MERLTLPQKFSGPGFLWPTVIAYFVPFSILLMFFVLFVAMTEGMGMEKVLFLLLGSLALLPFLIRDYRASRKTLVLDESGVRQMNGNEKLIPWPSVASVLVKESSIGYGSIVVTSKEGVAIKIPISHIRMKCGRVLHFLKQRTGLTETYGYE